MRSSHVLHAMFAGIALVMVSLPSPAGTPDAVTATAVRKAAPDFTLTDSKGGAIKLSDFKGKVVLLDFWATWCGGCKVEIPWYVEFQDKYKERGLATIGVSMDEDGWKAVKPFLEKNKINYPIVIGNDNLAKLYQVDAMPMTLLIDRDGKIAASHVGLVNKASFESEIQTLLQSGPKVNKRSYPRVTDDRRRSILRHPSTPAPDHYYSYFLDSAALASIGLPS